MTLSIPLRNDEYYRENLIIEEKEYIFQFLWNKKFEFWSLSIFDIDENIIVAGLKLKVNCKILPRRRYLEFPGEIWCISNDLSNDRIQKEDIDTRISLVYLSPDE